MNAKRKPSEDELCDEVHRLADEVRVLRESVDELTTALEWAIRNARILVEFEHASMQSPSRLPPVELFEIGDAVTFDVRGEAFFGEIVDLDDGRNVAMVQLIPSNTFLPIEQDKLTRVESDPLSYRDQPDSKPSEPPAPGELF